MKSMAVLLCFFCSISCQVSKARFSVFEGSLLAQRGNYTEAIAAYSKGFQDPVTRPYALYNVANIYAEIGETQSALELFAMLQDELGSRKDRSDAEVLRELMYRVSYNTGITQFNSGDYDGAVQSFRSALEVDSSRLEAKRNLELSLLAQSRKKNTASGARPLEIRSESAGANALFDYMREKDHNRWKSQKWTGTDEYLEKLKCFFKGPFFKQVYGKDRSCTAPHQN
jgi:Ca-activated chloride channel family protein